MRGRAIRTGCLDHPLVAGLCAAAGVAAASPSPAFAGHPLATDDAGTVAAGAAEVELSSGLVAGTEAAGRELAVGVGVRTGLTGSIDAGVGVVYTLVDAGKAWAADVDVPAIDVKWQLLAPRGGRPGLAVRLDYQPAEGAAARISGHHAGAVVVASWQHRRLGAHVNLGSYRHAEASGDELWACYGSVAGTYAVADPLIVGGELIADGLPGDLHGAGGLAGLGWELAPGRVASAGTGLLWQPDLPVAWVATVGLTASFGGTSP
jgi:hypothetical protein